MVGIVKSWNFSIFNFFIPSAVFHNVITENEKAGVYHKIYSTKKFYIWKWLWVSKPGNHLPNRVYLMDLSADHTFFTLQSEAYNRTYNAHLCLRHSNWDLFPVKHGKSSSPPCPSVKKKILFSGMHNIKAVTQWPVFCCVITHCSLREHQPRRQDTQYGISI